MGASGSGKTTLLQYIVHKKKLCKAAKKYSTRSTRPTVIMEDGTELIDDVTHKSLAELEKCDLLYESNNNKYGVQTSEIIDDLKKDNCIIVISDIRAIKFLKKKVIESGYTVKVIYILSKNDSRDEFSKTCQMRMNSAYENGEYDEISPNSVNTQIKNRIKSFTSEIKNDRNFCVDKVNRFCDDLKSYFPDSESNAKRFEKIKLVFKQYIYNIGLFDHVILNTTTLEDFYLQAENIITYDNNTNNMRISKYQRIKGPVIFVVFASPKSGKGTLMENLNIMGSNQIQITPKYSNRNPEVNDKRDGMIALGKKEFENKINSENDYLCWSFHGNSISGTKYAIKREDVIKRLNNGIPQIFVSNFNAVKRILNHNGSLKEWGNICSRFVYIYLHRVRTNDELKKQVSSLKKQNDVKKTHQDYIKNISLIDHVLINSDSLTFSEDLHDQMMSLIELYSEK